MRGRPRTAKTSLPLRSLPSTLYTTEKSRPLQPCHLQTLWSDPSIPSIPSNSIANKPSLFFRAYPIYCPPRLSIPFPLRKSPLRNLPFKKKNLFLPPVSAFFGYFPSKWKWSGRRGGERPERINEGVDGRVGASEWVCRAG